MDYKQLENLPFFQDLGIDSLNNLANHSFLKHYNKGELLFLHGDLTEYCYIIASGWIKLFRDTLDGQEAFIGLATEGDIVGEMDFSKNFHLFSAQTVSETNLLILPCNVMKESIESDGRLAFRIIKSLNSTVSLLELQIEHNYTMNAAQRIGCFILRLCANRKDKTKIKLPYDKALLAAHLGMKRETFSRALNILKPVGITVRGNTLHIKSIDTLVEFSCISCSLSYHPLYK